jgi:hypothetical protein
MMRGFYDAEMSSAKAKDPLQQGRPVLDKIIIDTHPEVPTAYSLTGQVFSTTLIENSAAIPAGSVIFELETELADRLP